MKLNKSLIAIIGFVLICILTLGYFFSDYLKYKQENIVKNYLDAQIKELFEKIKERKEFTTAVAILLSKNVEIKECLKINDKTKCEKYLKQIQDEFNESHFSHDIKIHMHTKNFRSFFRVWDLSNSKNDILVSFRESLQQAKYSKKAVTGLEIGRYSLLIRGVAPIFINDEYLGSIEVISDFENITRYFKEKDIDFFLLMDKKYEKIASMIEYPSKKRFNNFVIVNNINSGLDFLGNIELEDTSFIKRNNYYLIYTPVYDISNNKVGFYILRIPTSKLFS